MAKKHLPDDKLNAMLPSDTKGMQKIHKEYAEDTQKGEFKTYHIRFYENDWKRIRAYFKQKGITASAGIRLIVNEYLERHR